ncbi:MAG TPA: DUF3604 domain-containing protein [Candidatus Acidoferrales bacterium]|nr:DUF3604 domain-containing protein [Candidatus Acidoferrales bacterium]
MTRKRLLEAVLAGTATFAVASCRGQHQGPGEPAQTRLPAAVVAARTERQTDAVNHLIAEDQAATRPTKQILFGDLHVHTTYSADAFLRSLPMLQGEGMHPPADACDFARFCSGLDFFSINDHSESVSPQHWKETKDSIRQCNAVSGDPANPDLVAFVGWEWTQVGTTPANHYGHKNVIFRDTGDDQVPRRPISALNDQLIGALQRPAPLLQRIELPLFDAANRQRYFDFAEFQNELRAVPLCPDGVDTRQLPDNCHERALTPQALYEKLSQWGFDTIVIPHGTTWGFYTPPGTTFAKQLTAAQDDPDKQRLFEIYSGHGNSEEYRSWKDVDWDAHGNPVCPAPTKNYEPCCWRAGEIIRARCGDIPTAECEQRVTVARFNYLKAGVAGNMTVPGTTVEDWKDCGQCRDCFNPAFNLRPGNSAQYALAITNFDDPAHPRRFHFGFIGSSDNHSARPGTGYKEYGRHFMTETAGPRDAKWAARLQPHTTRSAESVPFDATTTTLQPFQYLDIERQASFFMTGGLVAVHAEGRDRNAIWTALKRREVYGTSGERILLWFDLLNAPDGTLPMGSDTALGVNPTFRVRAAGSFKQNPGCPESSTKALTPDRLSYVCRGECYNPSDERHLITRIEVVRIRPQQHPGEPVAPLIEDPWRRYDCPPDPAGCVMQFDDPDFLAGARDNVYYVRAVQEATPAINAGGLRCQYNENGECVKENPCYGDYRTPFDDDCLSPNEERAWSSPIYLRTQ